MAPLRAQHAAEVRRARLLLATQCYEPASRQDIRRFVRYERVNVIVAVVAIGTDFSFPRIPDSRATFAFESIKPPVTFKRLSKPMTISRVVPPRTGG